MFEKMLPIGSVVLIKNAMKKTLIIGYMQIGEREKTKLYDYVGIIYPFGTIGSESQFLFDHDEIQDIIFTGYKNSEYDDMITALEKEAENDPDFARSVKTKTVLPDDVREMEK